MSFSIKMRKTKKEEKKRKGRIKQGANKGVELLNVMKKRGEEQRERRKKNAPATSRSCGQSIR